MNNIQKALGFTTENKEDYTSIEEVIHTEAICVCGETIHFTIKRKLPWDIVKSLLTKIKNKAT